MKTVTLSPKTNLLANAADPSTVAQLLNQIIAQKSSHLTAYVRKLNLDPGNDLERNISNAAIDDLNKKIEILENQLSGSLKILTKTIYVRFLIHKSDGVLVSTRMFNGEYGACFITNQYLGISKFIGASRRLPTYLRKDVIPCDGKLIASQCSYLSKDGFVREVQFSPISMIAFDPKKTRPHSVGIVPELEEIVKAVNTAKWFNMFQNKNSR